MAKYLIVNADDFNTDEQRNLGILKAVREGIVTTSSMIVNPVVQEGSLKELRETLGRRIGIHLNLTKGVPFTSDANTLVDGSGQFHGKNIVWQRALMGRLDLKEVETEFATQISHLKDMGVQPDHIDGNNHIHIFPGIATLVSHLASDFGIRCIRLPLERFSKWEHYVRPNLFKKVLIGALSRRAKTIFRTHGLRFTDHFAGIQFPDVSSLDSLQSFLYDLREGTTELMCHPGYRNPSGNPFSSVERERELLSLTHPSVLERIHRLKINLISYSEFLE